MAISVQCRKCGQQYRLKDELAGRKIRCKKCGAAIAVPADDSGGGDEFDDFTEPEAPAPRRRAASPPAAPPARRSGASSAGSGGKGKKPAKKSAKSGPNWMFLGIAGGVLAVLAVVAVIQFTGGEPDVPVNAPVVADNPADSGLPGEKVPIADNSSTTSSAQSPKSTMVSPESNLFKDGVPCFEGIQLPDQSDAQIREAVRDSGGELIVSGAALRIADDMENTLRLDGGARMGARFINCTFQPKEFAELGQVKMHRRVSVRGRYSGTEEDFWNLVDCKLVDEIIPPPGGYPPAVTAVEIAGMSSWQQIASLRPGAGQITVTGRISQEVHESGDWKLLLLTGDDKRHVEFRLTPEEAVHFQGLKKGQQVTIRAAPQVRLPSSVVFAFCDLVNAQGVSGDHPVASTNNPVASTDPRVANAIDSVKLTRMSESEIEDAATLQELTVAGPVLMEAKDYGGQLWFVLAGDGGQGVWCRLTPEQLAEFQKAKKDQSATVHGTFVKKDGQGVFLYGCKLLEVKAASSDVIEVTAIELGQAIATDPAAASSKYANKKLRVTGMVYATITSFGDDDTDEFYLYGGDGPHVSFFVKHNEVPGGFVRYGQYLVVEGVCRTSAESVFLKDRRIVEVKPYERPDSPPAPFREITTEQLTKEVREDGEVFRKAHSAESGRPLIVEGTVERAEQLGKIGFFVYLKVPAGTGRIECQMMIPESMRQFESGQSVKIVGYCLSAANDPSTGVRVHLHRCMTY